MTSSLLERVQEALERAASLPPEQQDRVAADILSLIDQNRAFALRTPRRCNGSG
jgi:hypothetical protein